MPYRKGGRDDDEEVDSETAALQCNALKMATYLLVTAISSAEAAATAGKAAEGPMKKKGKSRKGEDEDSFDWVGCRDGAVSALVEVLGVDMGRLWTMGVPDEPFVNLFGRTAYQLLEQPLAGGRESALKKNLLQLVAKPLQVLPSTEATVVAQVMHLVNNHEHCVATVADICRYSALHCSDGGRLGTQVLREAVRIDLSSAAVKNGNGVKHLAAFLAELSGGLPTVVFANMSALLPLLDAEPYVLRSAVATAIGNVVLAPNPSLAGEEAGDEGEGKSEEDLQTRSQESFAATRDSLLNVLVERGHDVNSFTRAAVLRSCANLAEKQALPLKRIHAVCGLAVDRLQDKSQVVRKAACQLLVALLEHNPYMGSLEPTLYQAKAAEVEEWLRENPLPEDAAVAAAAAKEDASDKAETSTDDDDDNAIALMGDEDDNEGAVESAAVSELRAVRALKVRELDFFYSASAFIVLLESVAPKLDALLGSKTSADAVEALRFFVKAAHFSLPSAAKSLRRSWSLVWSQDAAVREETMLAFLKVHVCEPGASEVSDANALQPGRVATNLINVVSCASGSEQLCLEELLGKLVRDQRLPSAVFAALRKGAIDGGKRRAAAVLVLAMCAAADGAVLGGDKHLLAFCESTLSAHSSSSEEAKDWELVRCSCLVLRRAALARKPSLQPPAWEALALQQCNAVVRGEWCLDGDPSDATQWFAACEQAMAAAFALHPSPEQFCAAAVVEVHAKTLGASSNGSTSCAALARFCHLLGECALRLLVYTESAANRLKKAKQTGRQPKASKASGKAPAAEEDQLEAELGMGAEAELEHDTRVAEVLEQEIVGGGLLAAFEPLLLRLVANEQGAWGEETLRSAATLALTKYMTVSQEVCENHLPLLITALAAEVHPSVRGNTVVALGDLAFRFPNAVEPWTSHLYRPLRDESPHVRAQTLMVLTHLILNDMVKVKGQVAEMVLSLEDSEPKTADLAKLFFQELSKRGNNPIYNLMPDIVSRLSQDAQVSRDVFRRVMPFLLGFITKDKHSESLVEKLCHRFATCTDMSQTQDLAFCLAQLPLNDKGVKKLDSLLKCYRNALFDTEVYKSFEQLIAKAKKFAKPEMKDAVNEFADKIAACHNGVENDSSACSTIREDAEEGEATSAEGEREVLGEKMEANSETNDESAEVEVKRSSRTATKGKTAPAAAKDEEGTAPVRSSRGRTSAAGVR